MKLGSFLDFMKPVLDICIYKSNPLSSYNIFNTNEDLVLLHCSYITLQLQDYGRTPSAESEVKFQLSRISLEPMLRSMAYISEQLSTPANKVAVINLKVCEFNSYLLILPFPAIPVKSCFISIIRKAEMVGSDGDKLVKNG